jgi:hypothetical protein
VVLIGVRQSHGALQILRIVKFDIDPDMIRKTFHEELSLMVRH